MGYRSTIVIGVQKELVNDLDKIFDKGFEGDTAHWVDETHQHENGMKVYKIEQIKWYDDDPFVIEVEKFLDENSGEYEDDPKTFMVGLGEDGENHSEKGLWYQYVSKIVELDITQDWN